MVCANLVKKNNFDVFEIWTAGPARSQIMKFFIRGVYLPHRTRCSAIAERPRCRERYSFRQK